MSRVVKYYVRVRSNSPLTQRHMQFPYEIDRCVSRFKWKLNRSHFCAFSDRIHLLLLSVHKFPSIVRIWHTRICVKRNAHKRQLFSVSSSIGRELIAHVCVQSFREKKCRIVVGTITKLHSAQVLLAHAVNIRSIVADIHIHCDWS